MQIQFTRQHDGMLCTANTFQDITADVEEHGKLLDKLRMGIITHAEIKRMNELEEHIIDNIIDYEETGFVESPFAMREENQTMLCI